MNDKVSIIMGLYNCADTLPRAIESVIAQTYTSWELIMCDDGSTDDTYRVASEYKKMYPEKIILLRHETNKYLSSALNDCLKEATGYYVARMDGDDVSLPTRIETQVAFLKEHTDFHLVGTAMQRFHGDSLDDIVYPSSEYPSKEDLRYGTVFCHATVLTYRYVYEKLGGYRVSNMTRRSQDYDLWFRFYAAGFSGANLMTPLYLVREDRNAVKRRTVKNRLNIFRIQKNGYKLLGFPKRWLIKPFFDFLLKSIVPTEAVMIYRKMQRRKKQDGKDEH